MGKLTDIAIRNWVKSGERFEGRGDGEGLYVRYRRGDAVPRWVFRYQFAGKPRVLHLGSYASLSLADLPVAPLMLTERGSAAWLASTGIRSEVAHRARVGA